MHRLVIFAFYNKNCHISSYVISYLKFLHELSDRIIFIADNEPDMKELAKIYPYVCHIECKPHGEYDFGSYKRGFLYAKDNHLLDEVNEIIFCNDSCFCISSLKDAFDRMDRKACDFWSMTASNEYEPHLQSFFITVRRRMFMCEDFSSYLYNVKHLDNFVDIVKAYEIPLKRTFESLGFKGESYLEVSDKLNPTFYPTQCLKQHMPLIKRKLFTEIYGCRESLLFVAHYIKSVNKRAYNEILSFFNVQSIIPLWLNFAITKLKSFIYTKSISRRGTLKIQIFKIPVFILKTKNKCG